MTKQLIKSLITFVLFPNKCMMQSFPMPILGHAYCCEFALRGIFPLSAISPMISTYPLFRLTMSDLFMFFHIFIALSPLNMIYLMTATFLS